MIPDQKCWEHSSLVSGDDEFLKDFQELIPKIVRGEAIPYIYEMLERVLYLAKKATTVFSLRKLDVEGVRKNTLIQDLPVVQSGTWEVLNRWALDQGYRWKKDESLFGGYFVDNEGDCYYIT